MAVAGIDIALGQRAMIGVGVTAVTGHTFGYGIKGEKPPPHSGFFDTRLRTLVDLIMSVADRHVLELVVVEKPMAMRQSNSFSLQWMYGAVIGAFMRRCIPVLAVPTSTIRRLMTGRGNMKKDEFTTILARRYGDRRHDILEAMAYAELAARIAAGKLAKEPVQDAYYYAKKYMKEVEDADT